VTNLRRYGRKAAPFWLRDGAPVWYSPTRSARFSAIVEGRPWFAQAQWTWMVRLREVETACGTSRVACAALHELARRDLAARAGAP
jgi:hypothetical protein